MQLGADLCRGPGLVLASLLQELCSHNCHAVSDPSYVVKANVQAKQISGQNIPLCKVKNRQQEKVSFSVVCKENL